MSFLAQNGIIFLISLGLALAVTPLVRAMALRLSAVDTPDHRRVHTIPTPSLGGIAIFAAALAGMIFGLAHIRYFQGPALGGLLGSVIILLVGIVDDLYHIPPKAKLFGQILAAVLVIPFGVIVETSGLFWLDAMITVFWIVMVSNAFNLIDNMDGLSAGTAAIAAFFFFLLAAQVGQPVAAAVAAALCGACLGFLRYNFGPKAARIFMGDTGSLFLGFLLAILAVRLAYASPRLITPLVPIAILGLPLLDTTFVIIMRRREGRPITQGGKDHLSHRLAVAFRLRAQAAVVVLWLFAAMLGALGMLLAVRRGWAWLVFAGLALLCLAIMLTLSRRKAAFSDEEEMKLRERPRKKALVVLPTYNESENIAALIAELLAQPAPIEVLVVDDNSPDGTAAMVERLMEGEARVHLLKRPGKLGLGTAYMAGFSYGLENGYDYVITMDADFSHHPRYIPSLVEAAARHNLVIGSRYIKEGGVENWPWHRQVLSGGANLVTRLVLRLPTHDCTSGYRGYGREALETIPWREIKASGYAFLEEMLYRAHQARLSIGEVPIIFTDRRAGASKISKREIISAMLMLGRLGWERMCKKNIAGQNSAAPK